MKHEMTVGLAPSLQNIDAALPSPTSQSCEKVRPYSFYALAILIIANFFNYIDRNVISIVAEDIKADLGLDDAQLGFLMGTAFAALYGIVGIPLGRVSDRVNRTKLMAWAMGLWSLMTALSGFAANYAQLAAARIGVGLGEAAANPCSHSLLSDYFPSRNRAAALGAYMFGTFAGLGCSLFFGGFVIEHWPRICQTFPQGACSIASWQAAFLILGLPGLLVAVVVGTLREPSRSTTTERVSFFRLLIAELATVAPPFTFVTLSRIGRSGDLTRNLLLGLMLAAFSALLALASGDWSQWMTIGFCVYCICSFAQILKLRDAPLHGLTFGCRTFLFLVAGCALLGAHNQTISVWAAPYSIRQFHLNAAEAGLSIGLTFAFSSCIGVILFGLITDRWRRLDRRATIWMTMFSLVGTLPFIWVMLLTESFMTFVAAFFCYGLINGAWIGGATAQALSLVLPRMRGAAAAIFSLIINVTAFGFGPYAVGKSSEVLGSLRAGLFSIELIVPVAVLLLYFVSLRIRAEDEGARYERARGFGEP